MRVRGWPRNCAGYASTRWRRFVGPLIEGAFVASMVAEEMDVLLHLRGEPAGCGDDGIVSRPIRRAEGAALKLNGLRVAVVNDVINAGSAVQGTR